MHYHLALFAAMNYAVASLISLYIISYDGIHIAILLDSLTKRPPRTKVTPAKLGGLAIYLITLFQNGVVDGYVLTFGELLVNHILFPFCTIDGE